MKRLITWFKHQPQGIRLMFILILLLIIGVILRWPSVLEGIQKGFGYFNK